MLTMVVTLLFTLLLFGVVLLVLAWAPPYRRLTRQDVISLLRLVLDGRATEHDWRLFSALPLRHNPMLEAIRERCMDIEDREYRGPNQKGLLFTRKGLDELRDILAELEAAED